MDVNNRTLSKSMGRSRDYTLNGEMVIEREYQGSSIASVSIDIRSPAVDIANKLMEAFALESVGVIVRESSAARIIISLRVLRSVGEPCSKRRQSIPNTFHNNIRALDFMQI